MDSVDLRASPTASTADVTSNTTQLATTAFVRRAVSDLMGAAPETLDTLLELAAAIGDDANFASTITTLVGTKVNRAGDTLNGFLSLHADPVNALHAATKSYVDSVTTSITINSTDDVPEGATNLYFEDSRVFGAIGLSTDNSTVLDYNAVTGQFTYTHPGSDGILEGSTNKYYTDSRVRAAVSLTSDDHTILTYSSSTGVFTFTSPGTDSVTEGSTNLYFTTARARASIVAGSNISYNSSTGLISSTAAVDSVNSQTGVVILDTDNIDEGSANLYFTNSRARGAISLLTDDATILSYASGQFTFVTPSTDAILEDESPINLWFTNARAQAAVSANDAGGDGSFSYDNTNGVFTYTGPSATEVRAHISATDVSGDGSFSYDNTNGVFTYTGPSAAEVRAHLSVDDVSGDGSLSYSASTGVFTYTGPSAAEVRAHISAGTGVQFSSGVVSIGQAVETTSDVTFNDAIINGNLTVNGTTTTINATTLDVADLNITVAVGSANAAAANGAGLTVDGPTTPATLTYASATDSWNLNKDTYVTGVLEVSGNITGVTFIGDVTGDVTGTVSSLSNHDTDDLAESGSPTNLWFTNARARSSVSVTDVSGDGSLSYNDASGVFTFTGPSAAEVRAHISLITDNADALSYSAGVFTFNLSSVDTGEIVEGSNLYFTTSRARNSISSGANIAYNQSTGVISSTAAVDSVNSQTGVVILGTDDIDEGASNLYFTNARAQGAVSLDSDDTDILSYASGQFTFRVPSTDAILEDGSPINLWFTNARADARIAAASLFDLVDVGSTTGLDDGHSLVWNAADQLFQPKNVTSIVITTNFTGDGTTVSFSTGVDAGPIGNTQVFINGLVQPPTYSYTISTVSDVTSIVFDTAPEANDFIMVRVTPSTLLSAGGLLSETSTIDGGLF